MFHKLKWLNLSDDGVVAELAAISSLKEFNDNRWQLGEVMMHGDVSAGRDEVLYYRGTSLCADLVGRVETSTPYLKCTFDICRRDAHIDCSDPNLYWLMRHAGVDNTALIDWTACPEIAIWFAIHERNEQLRDSGEGALWVWRPVEDDYMIPDGERNPIPECGVSKSVVYYPYDVGESYERPTMQEAIAVRLRFQDALVCDRVQPLLPMNHDLQFRGRLLKIAIEGDYGSIEKELNSWLYEHTHHHASDMKEYLGLGDGGDYVIPRVLVRALNERREAYERS